MIKVSVLYPNGSDVRFDYDYYCGQHTSMVTTLFGKACSKITIGRGLAGGAPGQPATYVTMTDLYFDSVESFQAAFAPHAATIMGDLPNFTNSTPVIQISEVIQ
jgi:uncharacterized protein (TIGR02118 family)